MSTFIATEGQIAQYRDEIAKGVKPSIPMGALSKSMEGIKSGLGNSEPPALNDVFRHEALPTRHTQPPGEDAGHSWRRLGTSLDEVPFAVLGATPRDTRQRIIELAEERSLELDPVICQKARSDLTNPRTRLAAELAWFPGLSPGKIVKCLDALHHDPMSIRNEASLPQIARLNLMAYALEMVQDFSSEEDTADFLWSTAELADDIDPDIVLRDINEDRSVAGFPPLQSTEQVEAALSERKRSYRQIMKGALNRMSSAALVRVLTEAVDLATASGETPAPALIDDLVDSYAVEVQSALDAGAERIRKLMDAVKLSVSSGPAAVDANIAQLEIATRKWDAIAQPIQLSAKARGTGHDISSSIAYGIRGLAIDLFNNHDLLAQSQRLTKLLQEVFAELPEVLERIDKDAGELEEIAQRRVDADAFIPIRSRCEQASASADKNPVGAHLEGQRLLSDGLALLKAVPVDPESPAYRDAKNLLAATLMHCAIEYGNKTSRWEPCIVLLERALELAMDATLRQRINENLSTAKSNHADLGGCEPITNVPSLHTINGVGFTLYGNTDPRPDGSHMATYYFVVLGIPVFPITRYRVIPTGGGYRFLGKAGLRSFDKWHLGISLALIGWMILAAMA